MFRFVSRKGASTLNAFLASSSAHKLLAAGAVVGARIVPESDLCALRCAPDINTLVRAQESALVLQHDRIPFPSFPYESPPEMLHAAAVVTIDLAKELLADSLGLKGATPYNILFSGPNPVFIDLLSFERRDPLDAAWGPYAQFVRVFLLPLLVNRHYGQKLDQLLLAGRDGLEPEEVYSWFGALRRLAPPFVSLVNIPTSLARLHRHKDDGIYCKRLRGSSAVRKKRGSF